MCNPLSSNNYQTIRQKAGETTGVSTPKYLPDNSKHLLPVNRGLQIEQTSYNKIQQLLSRLDNRTLRPANLLAFWNLVIT